MNWQTIQATIKAQVAALGDLPALGAVEWQGTKEATSSRPDVRVLLSFQSSAIIGSDEERRDNNAPDADQTAYIAGNRTINIQVRIETEDQRFALSCRTVADKIRTRLGRTSVIGILSAAGLSLADVTEVIDFEATDADRLLSVCTFELVFNAAENDIDTTLGSGDYIESVQYESNTLDGVDGVPIVPQVNETVTGA